jgi:hypothetical protein
VVPSARPNSPAAALIPELTAAGGTVTAFTNKDAHNGSEARSDSDAGDPVSLSLSRGRGSEAAVRARSGRMGVP